MRIFGKRLSSFEKSYFSFLINSYKYLEFRGMGISHQVPLKLSLLDLYVPLRALILGRPRNPYSNEEAVGVSAGAAAPELISLVDASRATIVLGDPGSGKTTFLKLMALLLAGIRSKPAAGGYVPYLLPLSAYALELASHELSLADFLTSYLKGRGFLTDDVGDEVRGHLQDGRACLLLDGLDEINDLGLRGVARQKIQDFIALYGALGNKVVVTSRIVGYDAVRILAEGVTECQIGDFSEDDILDFVDKWTRAVERAARDTSELSHSAADQQRAELVQAIRTNDGVRELSRSPMLLTVMAIMKRADIELPQRRVELYHKSIEALLKYWNLARSLGRGGYAVVDVLETIRVLASVALWMHQLGEGLAIVSQRRLEDKLEELFVAKGYEDARIRSASFLREIKDVNSVLVERGQEQFCFAHLTFQEYLAAVGLVLSSGDAPDELAVQLQVRLRDDVWWEVGLLAIAYVGVIQQRDTGAGRALQKLLQGDKKRTDEYRSLVIFSGQAIADCWPAGVSAEGRGDVVAALMGLSGGGPRVPTKIRLKAADLLGRIASPKPELCSLDGMEFSFVPEGEFMAMANPTPSTCSLPYGFWISRFPVSQAQYAEFFETGFCEDRFWTPSGLRWRNDPAVEKTLFLPRSFRTPTRPVCAVTVYECEAYAAWATESLRASGAISTGQRLALPNEMEWVKAARGGLNIPSETPLWKAASGSPCVSTNAVNLIPNSKPVRVYPMGTLRPADANFFASEWNETSAIGCYDWAAGPYGSEEMCGNVWEWLRTHWGPDWEESLFGLPYASDDGREDMTAPDDWMRMVKGGSYSMAEQMPHLAIDYRTRNSPDGRYLNHGFRLVIIEHQ